MIVDIDNLKVIKGYLKQINNTPFEDIVWYENSEKLEFSKEYLDNWKFIGLNNCDFIITGYYKGEK